MRSSHEDVGQKLRVSQSNKNVVDGGKYSKPAAASPGAAPATSHAATLPISQNQAAGATAPQEVDWSQVPLPGEEGVWERKLPKGTNRVSTCDW